MSQSSNNNNKVVQTKNQQRRKTSVWTREKISKLIELYRSSECLWNHYSLLYKNKDCRQKAIDDICVALNITKFEFGKKVHNLRNQFNSEMKKVERRLDESGGILDESKEVKACRWPHFETLMFLRSVIEPRPGYQFKKMRTKEDVEDIPTAKLVRVGEEAVRTQVLPDEVQRTEVDVLSTINTTSQMNIANSSQIGIGIIKPESGPQEHLQIISNAAVARDQWDAFGELIADEFRNLSSDLSRKKLKRKIMQVMLEVGIEDDQHTNSHV